jgi:hypothetical protein
MRLAEAERVGHGFSLPESADVVSNVPRKVGLKPLREITHNRLESKHTGHRGHVAQLGEHLLCKSPKRLQSLYSLVPFSFLYDNLGHLLPLESQPQWSKQVAFGHSSEHILMQCRMECPTM